MITSNANKHTNIRFINSQLEQTGLLTMVNGLRPKPVSTSSNLFGYSPRRIITPAEVDDSDRVNLFSTTALLSFRNTSIVDLREDDIGVWNHDYARLMCLLPSMFSTEYLNLAVRNIRNAQSIEVLKYVVVYSVIKIGM
jgi:hypothetical protein